MEFIIYLITGACSGFIAGLFGIGGGLILVPILALIFSHLNYDPNIIMHMAIGTSLSAMIITSIGSVMAHKKNGNILWPVFRHLAMGMIIGALIGASITNHIPGHYLKLIIGCFSLWIAYSMFRDLKNKSAPSSALPSVPMQSLTGGAIGIASAIFGIGGGSFTVPYLSHHSVPMKKSVGTSAACGLVIAIVATTGFMWFGTEKMVHVPQAIGYINIQAFLGIGIMSFITAKYGAKAANNFPAKKLKASFAVLMIVIAVYFFYQFFKV
jgi:uncharacterized protein